MSDLVGNPDCWYSQAAAHIIFLRASWKISFHIYVSVCVYAKCCDPRKIKTLLTYLLCTEVGSRICKMIICQNYVDSLPSECYLDVIQPSDVSKKYAKSLRH